MPQVERIDDYRWRIPRQGGMRTEGLIFADEQLMRDLEGDQAVQQVANVAHLPGIVGPAIAMPDIHWGYGFPIGGVAAFDEEEGVVSPGGVGYDINCGARLLVAPLGIADVRPRLPQLVDALVATIPCGAGPAGSRSSSTRGHAAWAARCATARSPACSGPRGSTRFPSSAGSCAARGSPRRRRPPIGAR